MKSRSVLAWIVAGAVAASAGAQEREGIEVQKGRDERVRQRGAKQYYTERWDLGDLPTYKPEQVVTGVLRQMGSNYFEDGNLNQLWEEGFRKHHPEVKFQKELKTALAAIPALTFGMADLAPSRHITNDEALFFQRYKNRHPVEIAAVTGSLNVPGWSYALAIVVHKDNPLAKVSIEQLDGIFGAERDGAFIGTTWRTEYARGPEKNIRTWGQLGLTGEWADKPINVYGFNLRYHIPLTFAKHIMFGAAKWNERTREYTNYKRPDGTTELEAKQVVDAIGTDRYGIAYSTVAFLTPETKAIPVIPRGGSAPVPLDLQTLRARQYPLYDEVYFYFDREPGKPIDPRVKEFLRYVLSREGQDAVQRNAKYLPLTATVAAEQRKKLD